MAEAGKLCPLSFGFSLKQQIPSILEPKKVDLKIQIGFPCFEKKCNWWNETLDDCIIWDINRWLSGVCKKLLEEK